ncbi:MAG TPA: hypothetical protein VNB24_07535 [Acidimicrobiales bacterium]|nr:hypothetical protein [Acidimicrobiales bacterium]
MSPSKATARKAKAPAKNIKSRAAKNGSVAPGRKDGDSTSSTAKSPAKKASPRKAVAKKAPAKKAPAKKAVATKTPAKKAVATKTAAKKAVVKKSPAKKAPAKRTVANRASSPAIAVKRIPKRTKSVPAAAVVSQTNDAEQTVIAPVKPLSRENRSAIGKAGIIALALLLVLMITGPVTGDGSDGLELSVDSTPAPQASLAGQSTDSEQSAGRRRNQIAATPTTAAPVPIVVNVVSPPPAATVAPAPTQPARAATPPTTAAPTPRRVNGQARPVIDSFFATTSGRSAGVVTNEVQFRWYAGDADGFITGYAVDYGDGTGDGQNIAAPCDSREPADPIMERPSFFHRYSQPGTYEVRLIAFSSGTCGAGPVQEVRSTITVQVPMI